LESTLGFFMVGVAASLGVLRFGYSPATFLQAHQFCSAIAISIGVPLICLSFLYVFTPNAGFGHHLPFQLAGLIVPFCLFQLHYQISLYPTLVGVATMLVAITLGNTEARIAVMLYVVAALAVGAEGRGWLGVLNVDWFHYIISVANILFVLSLQKLLSHSSRSLGHSNSNNKAD